MATLTAEGQVTIPKAILERLRLKPGDEVTFEVDAGGTSATMRPEDGKDYATVLDRYWGIAGPGPTTDEVMEMTRGEP